MSNLLPFVRTPNRRLPMATRLWSGAVEDANGCWVWSRSTDWQGYGHIGGDGGRHSVHRVAYELMVGPIPGDRELDHLCRVRACINPAHLEPVTHAENCLRGESPFSKKARATHCKHGHEFTPENTYHPPKRPHRRYCLSCVAMRNHKRFTTTDVPKETK